MCGRALPGEKLGHGDKVNKTQPTLVEGLLDHPLVQVTCGWSHTVGLTSKGKVRWYTMCSARKISRCNARQQLTYTS